MHSVLDDPVKLEALLIELDTSMKNEGIKIPARGLHAMMLISERLNCIMELGTPISNRINQWFSDRYGDLYKVDPCIGKSVVLVAGDPYLGV